MTDYEVFETIMAEYGSSYSEPTSTTSIFGYGSHGDSIYHYRKAVLF